ncbi:hypothetical protein CFR80_14795 [Komagataeibacter oboediens]|uniref:Uncharacterized protein n=1 Tax=Komagataeibacter oboediens TaxID=65958 RepID=A0A318QJ96_9PROT|nr:hypothetical protein [Komagataeibacter oboediens]PYD79757.1 hypothetical protein CFR80_14795 [Komagataeibacter oboediens]
MTANQTDTETYAAIIAGLDSENENDLQCAFEKKHSVSMETHKRLLTGYGLPAESAKKQVLQMAEVALEEQIKDKHQHALLHIDNIREGQEAAAKQEAANARLKNNSHE